MTIVYLYQQLYRYLTANIEEKWSKAESIFGQKSVDKGEDKRCLLSYLCHLRSSSYFGISNSP